MSKKRSPKAILKANIKKNDASIINGYSKQLRQFQADRLNYLTFFILLSIIAIIIIGPFFYGFFFERHYLPLHVISFALFLVWWIAKLLRKDRSLLHTPLDCFVLMLVVFYFISQFNAVYPRHALAEYLKIANYAAIYFMVTDISRKIGFSSLFRRSNQQGSLRKKDLKGKAKMISSPDIEEKEAGRRKTLLNGTKSLKSTMANIPLFIVILYVLMFSGLVVSIVGLGAAAGTWDMEGSFVQGRIVTPIGYSNTSAAYIMSAFFIYLGLVLVADRWFLRPLFMAPSIILIAAFFFTYSRGAWIMFPIFCLLFVLISLPGNRLRAFLYLSVICLGLLPFLPLLDNAFHHDFSLQAWLYLLLCAILVVFGGYLIEYLSRFHYKIKLALIGIIAIILVSGGLYYITSKLAEPIALSTPADSSPSERYIEHRIGDIAAGEEHTLSLKVNAYEQTKNNYETTEYVWKLLVLAYDLEDHRKVLLDKEEGATANWEKREYNFTPGYNHYRMVLRLYNKYPGTGFQMEDITLDQGESEKVLNFAFSRLLPDRVYRGIFSRITSMDLRIAHSRDALKIIGDYPVLGVGGGGWEALYRSYQDEKYFTTEVHNHFLQIWIESGLFGFAAFLGMWFSLLLAFIMNRKNVIISDSDKQLWTAVLVSAMALGAHSAIDWNLSYGLVAIFLFILFGVGNSLDQVHWFKDNTTLDRVLRPLRQYFATAILLITLFLLIYTAMLTIGINNYKRGQEMFSGDNFTGAEYKFSQAIRYDPLRADSYYYLSRINEKWFESKGDPFYEQSFHSLAERAYKLEPYNPDYIKYYGNVLINLDEAGQGLDYLEKLIYVRPLDQMSYRYYARIILNLSEKLLSQKKAEDARDYLQRLLELEKIMVDQYGSSDPINFHLGGAYFLLDEHKAALHYLRAVDKNDDNYEEAKKLISIIDQEFELP